MGNFTYCKEFVSDMTGCFHVLDSSSPFVENDFTRDAEERGAQWALLPKLFIHVDDMDKRTVRDGTVVCVVTFLLL